MNNMVRNFRKKPELDLCLNLGCGNQKWPNWVNIDVRPMAEADLVCDVRDLPYDDGIVDSFVALDLLEHFESQEWRKVLAHWISKLKPGGFFCIRVPDIRVAVALHTDDDYLVRLIFGGQDYPENTHKTAFTAKILLAELDKLNVRIAKQFHNPAGNLIVEGYKK